MEEHAFSSKSSWFTRSHFSTTVYHRTSDSFFAPFSELDLRTNSQSLPRSTIGEIQEPQPSLSQQSSSSKKDALDLEKNKWKSPPQQSGYEPDFSFPSPFSCNLTTDSDSSADFNRADSLIFSDILLQARDEETGSGYPIVSSSPNILKSPSSRSIDGVQSPILSGRSGRGSTEDLAEEGKMSKCCSVVPPSNEKWIDDISELFVGQKFASGTYSQLYHGLYKENCVAVKVIRQPDVDKPMADRLEKLFSREVMLRSDLHHQKIVEFIAAFKRPPALCLITEYLSGGSLRTFLRNTVGQSLPMKLLLSMAIDIASGMEYLHMQGVIHRDLKSENLVLSDDLSVKITDFGVACYERNCDCGDLGTYRWMAPEMISRKPYSRMVDVYSFGIVLWELLSRELPFGEMSAIQAAFAAVNKNARPTIPADCPPALEKLTRQCWSADPKQRPEFWEILRVLHKLEESLESGEGLLCSSGLKCLPGW